MMWRRSITLAAVAAVLSGGAFVAQADTSASDAEARLKAAERKLAAQASATKGAAEQSILMEKKRVDALIDDLESGRNVDPSEIDDALRQANQVP
jgi:hypothetical protein